MTVTSARHGLIIGLKKLNPFVPNALFLYPLKKSENFKNGLSDYSFIIGQQSLLKGHLSCVKIMKIKKIIPGRYIRDTFFCFQLQNRGEGANKREGVENLISGGSGGVNILYFLYEGALMHNSFVFL